MVRSKVAYAHLATLPSSTRRSKQLTLLRHASVAGNLEQRYVGSTDCELTREGRSEARHVADWLADQSYDLVWCSPLIRARHTLDLIRLSHVRNKPLPGGVIMPALREIDFGRWENHTFDELQRRDPGLITQWHQQGDDFAFPGGETIRDFFTRVDEVVERIFRSTFDSLLIVTHGGIIRHLLCRLLNQPTEHSYAFKIAPASVTKLELLDRTATLTALNASAPRGS